MTRRVAALGFALALAIGAVVVRNGGGDYNANPTYCHAHDPTDFLWWYYECWLPDPPGGPY